MIKVLKMLGGLIIVLSLFLLVGIRGANAVTKSTTKNIYQGGLKVAWLKGTANVVTNGGPKVKCSTQGAVTTWSEPELWWAPGTLGKACTPTGGWLSTATFTAWGKLYINAMPYPLYGDYSVWICARATGPIGATTVQWDVGCNGSWGD